ncbi:hypothetical protein [Micromonospora foliorum]|uniref:hypothetical protein n=1 Tax=Micromonospora foliorum TaxID=2911210 RepID=UPI001EE928D8|nr:hypothetical protein [Micromonospora foliorum]MCG5436437.1 hypothetical protein [Micromonospora foliorum]
MSTVFTRGVPAALLTVALLSGCGGDANTGTAGSPAPAASASQQPTASIVGLLLLATNDAVVIKLPDGNTRTFGVRAEDAPRLGIRHLASHAGLTDIGFRITYVTVDGKDHVVAAEETAPPQ